MSRLSHVPDSLWARLDALDARCDSSFNRENQFQHIGGGGRVVWARHEPDNFVKIVRRAWIVQISIRDLARALVPYVVAGEPQLADALERALCAAESYGWQYAESMSLSID